MWFVTITHRQQVGFMLGTYSFLHEKTLYTLYTLKKLKTKTNSRYYVAMNRVAFRVKGNLANGSPYDQYYCINDYNGGTCSIDSLCTSQYTSNALQDHSLNVPGPGQAFAYVQSDQDNDGIGDECDPDLCIDFTIESMKFEYLATPCSSTHSWNTRVNGVLKVAETNNPHTCTCGPGSKSITLIFF